MWGYEEVKSEEFMVHLVGRGEPAHNILVSWELQGLQTLTVNLSELMLNLKWVTLIQS
jgi:hypothetical protein